MKVKCPGCKKAYNIPDERIPKDKKIAFPCPECKELIEIDARSKPAKDVSSGEVLKKRILRSVSDLPPMPQTVMKARDVISDPNSNFKQLAEVLKADPAIATRVLKMANSPYYGLAGEVSSLQQASVVLGHRTIGDLITAAGTSKILGNTLNGYGLEAGFLWRHSLGVAFGSKVIADKKNSGLANDAFAAGLIHDTGKIILDQHVLERKAVFVEFMADGEQSFLNAEHEILGFDHSEIASEVCKSWNVPENLTIAIRYHHYPSQAQENELAYIVHMADAFAMMTGLGLGDDGLSYRMDDKAVKFLGLKETDITEIMGEVVESVEKISEQMDTTQL